MKWLLLRHFKQKHGVCLLTTIGLYLILGRIYIFFKRKWENTYHLNQLWGKETHTWLKGRTQKFAGKIGRELNHYYRVFFNFFSVFFKCRRFIITVCFRLHVQLVLTPEFSWRLYTPRSHQIQYIYKIQVCLQFDCFLRWFFCRLLFNFKISVYSVINFLLFLLYLLHLLFDCIIPFVWRLLMFSFHILTSVCQFKFSSYFLVLHFASIATTTAVYQVDPVAYEV